MKRLAITIDEDLDRELSRLATAESTTKAAVIRRFIREALAPLPPLSADPLGRMVGVGAFEPVPIFEAVYR